MPGTPRSTEPNPLEGFSETEVGEMRRELLASITPEIWEEAHRGFGDPDLATQLPDET